jgi:hypothetical protein
MSFGFFFVMEDFHDAMNLIRDSFRRREMGKVEANVHGRTGQV